MVDVRRLVVAWKSFATDAGHTFLSTFLLPNRNFFFFFFPRMANILDILYLWTLYSVHIETFLFETLRLMWRNCHRFCYFHSEIDFKTISEKYVSMCYIRCFQTVWRNVTLYNCFKSRNSVVYKTISLWFSRQCAFFKRENFFSFSKIVSLFFMFGNRIVNDGLVKFACDLCSSSLLMHKVESMSEKFPKFQNYIQIDLSSIISHSMFRVAQKYPISYGRCNKPSRKIHCIVYIRGDLQIFERRKKEMAKIIISRHIKVKIQAINTQRHIRNQRMANMHDVHIEFKIRFW